MKTITLNSKVQSNILTYLAVDRYTLLAKIKKFIANGPTEDYNESSCKGDVYWLHRIARAYEIMRGEYCNWPFEEDLTTDKEYNLERIL